MNEMYESLPIISRTVSGLNAFQVPFESACCNSSALINPLLSLSTLKWDDKINNTEKI